MKFAEVVYSTPSYLLSIVIVEGRSFYPPASADQIARLRQDLPSETPPDYFDFLARSDGAHVWFDEDAVDFGCIRIFSVARMLQLQDSFKELFPSLVVIGGDQGTQYFAYNLSVSNPWPIVMMLPGYGAKHVAASFTELSRLYFLNPGEEVEK